MMDEPVALSCSGRRLTSWYSSSATPQSELMVGGRLHGNEWERVCRSVKIEQRRFSDEQIGSRNRPANTCIANFLSSRVNSSTHLPFSGLS